MLKAVCVELTPRRWTRYLCPLTLFIVALFVLFTALMTPFRPAGQNMDCVCTGHSRLGLIHGFHKPHKRVLPSSLSSARLGSDALLNSTLSVSSNLSWQVPQLRGSLLDTVKGDLSLEYSNHSNSSALLRETRQQEQSSGNAGSPSSLSAVPSAENILSAVLENKLSRSDRNTMALLLQLDWGETDVTIEEYSEYFAKNQNRAIIRVPELLAGQENGCGDAYGTDLESPYLLVVVPSVASHVTARQAIRNTWASPAYPHFVGWPLGIPVTQKVKTVFIFGATSPSDSLQLKREQERYGDVVQYDFVDTYHNLTVKMLSALHWTSHFCPAARYVLKVDEDTMVNLPVLLSLLRSMSSRVTRFILGNRISKAPPLRSGKWKVSSEQYPLPIYPAYVEGHSYVITGNVIRQLLKAAIRYPLLPFEDVFITGIVAGLLHVPRVHSAAMANTDRRVKSCEAMQGAYLSQTHFNSKSLATVWNHAYTGLCGTLSAVPR